MKEACVPNPYREIEALSPAPFEVKNCCKVGRRSLEFPGVSALSGGGRRQHLQARRHECSRAARLHPAHYSRFVIVPRPISPWREQREEGCLAVPGLSALRRDPGLLLSPGISLIRGEDNTCSQHWHVAIQGSCYICQGDLHAPWAALPKPPVVTIPIALLVYRKQP